MVDKSDFILTDPDFEAELFYLSKLEGGRSLPIHSGYRGQFYYDSKDWDCIQQFLNKSFCNPGETVNVSVKTASPTSHFQKLFVGKLFEIREGLDVVGVGEVTRIINNELNKLNLNSYELKIEHIIKANSQMKVDAIFKLQSLRYTNYNADQYQSIAALMASNKWYLIKENLEKKTNSFGQYLNIVSFIDETDRRYIASFYESDDLWQDPELVDLFLLK